MMDWRKLIGFFSCKAKAVDIVSQSDLHISTILPPKFLYKSVYGICPQIRLMRTFCLFTKNTYSSLFLTINSTLQKKSGHYKRIKLSLLTGVDECYLERHFWQNVANQQRGHKLQIVFFKEIRNQKEVTK